jgi:hypothetical protein
MVKRATKKAEVLPAVRSPRRDEGATFIELLVAIVLLGTVVVATLAGVRATVIGTTLDRDHSNAHAWLQSATDLLYGHTRHDCGHPTDSPAQKTTTKGLIIADYQAVAQGVPNAEGWPPSNITVTDVLYWDGDVYQATCYDDFAINLQLIKLQVRDTAGRIVEDVEVVKGA